MNSNLADLGEGEKGIVALLRLPPEQSRTLTRLGLVPGTEVLCLRRLPLGDPAVYRWRGTDLALRRREASRVEMRKQRIVHAVGGGAFDAPCQPNSAAGRAVRGPAPTVLDTGGSVE